VAERRMFAKTIIDSDAFLDMPASTQSLYFHLSMRADDDGFINNPKKIVRMINSSDDDLKLLYAKNFILTFESGVIVIKHWRIHNYIQKDRYKNTVYEDEKSLLTIKTNGAYTFKKSENESCIHDVSISETQVRLGKVRLELGKESIGEGIRHKYGSHSRVLLSDEEYLKLKDQYPNDYDKKITKLDTYIQMKGAKYTDHYLTMITWAEEDAKAAESKTGLSKDNQSNKYDLNELEQKLKDKAWGDVHDG